MSDAFVKTMYSKGEYAKCPTCLVMTGIAEFGLNEKCICDTTFKDLSKYWETEVPKLTAEYAKTKTTPSSGSSGTKAIKSLNKIYDFIDDMYDHHMDIVDKIGKDVLGDTNLECKDNLTDKYNTMSNKTMWRGARETEIKGGNDEDAMNAVASLISS